MRRNSWKSAALAVAAVGVLAGCTQTIEEATPLGEVFGYQSPAVTARRALMRKQNAAFKALKKALKAGNTAAAIRAAKALGNTAKQVPAAFARMSLAGKTTARAKIWKQKSQFDQVAANLALSTDVLIMALESGDKSGMANGLKTIGANCGKCHKTYRVPKKKK